MGIYRFILAFLVLLSHTPGSYLKGNFGQMAVLAFYFISGLLMAMSYDKFRLRSVKPIRSFLLDRVVKLWPTYMLVFFVSLAIYPFLGIEVDWRRALAEVFILPAAYTKMLPWGSHGMTVVPPAWSLGVEAHFYLAMPLIANIAYERRIKLGYVAVLVHLIIVSASSPIGRWGCLWPIQPGICTIPISDYLGFDLPFFVGVTFLLGTLCYESLINRKRLDAHLLCLWGMYAACLFVVAPYRGWITNLSAYEILFGMTFLVPASLAVFLLTKNLVPGKVDSFLGGISYPLFLVHFLVLRILHFVFDGQWAVRDVFLLNSRNTPRSCRGDMSGGY